MNRKPKVGEFEFLRQTEMSRVKHDAHRSSQLLPLLLVCPSKIRVWGMFALGRSDLPSYPSVSVMTRRNLTARGWYLLAFVARYRMRLVRYYLPCAFSLPFSPPRGGGHALRGLSRQPMVRGASESLCWTNSSHPAGRFACEAIENKRG